MVLAYTAKHQEHSMGRVLNGELSAVSMLMELVTTVRDLHYVVVSTFIVQANVDSWRIR